MLAALRFMSRDNGRTPMQWDDTAHAGFTKGQPWIDVNPNYKEINAEAQAVDEDSVLFHYQRLIQLRHELPVVAHGDFTMLLEEHPYVYAFTRRLEDEELLVLGNFSAEQQQVEVADVESWLAAELLLTNVAQEEPSTASMHLAPWESRIYLRRRGAGPTG
jgi:oligo-1,6-glucosidase